MTYRNANTTDIEVIKKLLNDSQLPSEDIIEHLNNFMVYQEQGKIIGVGGLERHGSDGLIRSFIIKPTHQGKGIGKSIYQRIEDNAQQSGIDTLYLLTETAVAYFEKLGFTIKARAKTPASISNTKQFKELCPATATVMFRKLSERNQTT